MAIELFKRVKNEKKNDTVSSELLILAAEATDSNRALFDAAHNFSGCIAELHEILKRQGLMSNIYCLNPNETLSDGQLQELDRVCKMYPHLSDDEFIKENIEKWKKDLGL